MYRFEDAGAILYVLAKWERKVKRGQAVLYRRVHVNTLPNARMLLPYP